MTLAALGRGARMNADRSVSDFPGVAPGSKKRNKELHVLPQSSVADALSINNNCQATEELLPHGAIRVSPRLFVPRASAFTLSIIDPGPLVTAE